MICDCRVGQRDSTLDVPRWSIISSLGTGAARIAQGGKEGTTEIKEKHDNNAQSKRSSEVSKSATGPGDARLMRENERLRRELRDLQHQFKERTGAFDNALRMGSDRKRPLMVDSRAQSPDELSFAEPRIKAEDDGGLPTSDEPSTAGLHWRKRRSRWPKWSDQSYISLPSEA